MSKLKRLVRIRKFQEHQKKFELAQINQGIMRNRDQIRDVNQETVSTYKLLERISQPQGAALASLYYSYIQSNYRKIKKVKKKYQILEKQYSDKKQELTKAMKNLKAVEKLKLKRDQERKEKMKKKVWGNIEDIIFSRRAGGGLN